MKSMYLASRPVTLALLAALLGAGWMGPAAAFRSQNTIVGTMVASDSNCPAPVPVFDLDDCSYDASDPTGFGTAEWIGPLFNAGYYVPGAGPRPAGAGIDDPQPGDGKTSPAISGTFYIDDSNTPLNGADDKINATIVIGVSERNFGAGARGTAVEQWTSLTLTIPGIPPPSNPPVPPPGPVTVSSATPNAQGGFDYVIGSRGMPPRLVDAATGTDIWPSETGADADAAIGVGHYWAAPSPIGIAPIEANASIGTTASFVATGYSCIDILDGINGQQSACDAQGKLGDGVNVGGMNFENILIALSTNSAGSIISATLIWVQEQNVVQLAPGLDSWVAGLMQFTGACSNCGPPRDAVDDPDIAHVADFTVDTLTSADLPVTDNDTNFDPPATLVISTAPDHGGTAVVQGSPGSPSDITVRYTPAPGFTGTETFQYTLSDAVAADTATVTVAVIDRVPVADDDQGNVIEGGTVDIAVTTGDTAGSGDMAAHTITITQPPAIGTATVIAGNLVRYTAPPDSFPGDSFQYTLTDANGDVSPPATVSVGIGLAREPTPAGGVSSLDPWLLLAMAGIGLVRRPAARQGHATRITVE